MIRKTLPKRSTLLTRSALAVALTLGLGGGLIGTSPALAAKEKEKPAAGPKISLSKAFIPVYSATNTMITAAAARPDVVAAQGQVKAADQAYRSASGRSARATAKTNLDAAVAALGGLLAAEKAKVEEAYAAATAPDDKYAAGQLGLNLGNVALDNGIRRRALQAMVDSGKTSPADLMKFTWFIGSFAYEAKDYQGAITALNASIAAGNTDTNVKTTLAESQIAAGQTTAGLATLKSLIDAAVASGQPAPAEWYDRGVQLAYQAKLTNEPIDWSIMRLGAYPNDFNWISAVQILREKMNYGPNEGIDLSRLLDRTGALKTNSQSVQREYVEYLQAAVGRAGVLYPGEVVRVGNQGLAMGALQRSDIFVTDALAEANRRLTADKASLPGLERDGRAPAATAKISTIAADTLLSYGEAAKAADLYVIAAGKPGVDMALVNTRLGVALFDQGKFAEAQAALVKVDGTRKPIAQLWAILAAQKAKPAV